MQWRVPGDCTTTTTGTGTVVGVVGLSAVFFFGRVVLPSVPTTAPVCRWERPHMDVFDGAPTACIPLPFLSIDMDSPHPVNMLVARRSHLQHPSNRNSHKKNSGEVAQV